MSDSSVCVNVPNGVIYVLIFGAIVAALGNLCGMSCPFLSNYMQNTVLLINMNGQIDAQRNQENV